MNSVNQVCSTNLPSDVLPLVYNALESDHAIVSRMETHFVHSLWVYQVQECALKTVPGLCDSIDFAEVQNVLFPRVAVSCDLDE